ncbi:MAG: beta-ketoacyl-ACP synthase II [Chloroflexi bacterium]|nr:beta-ketoacyl-ACP synthase II [Chloroflexota bacterium]
MLSNNLGAHRKNSSPRRVVATGMGAVSPLGLTVEEFWQGLIKGRSGIGPMTLCDTKGFPCTIAGEVKDFDPADYIEPKEARRMARFSQLAIAAARMAMEDAQLDLSRENMERVGVLLGNGNGGFPTTEEGCRVLVAKGGMRINPFFMPMILPNMAASQISLLFGIRGYNSTIITACAAGTQAIGEAREVILSGRADVMVAGGTEAGISQLGLAGFCVMRALTTKNEEPTKASRPFDAHRDGFVPAEGAAILILETLEHARSRGAPILAELVGYGVSSDAYHIVAPDGDGTGAMNAMRWALEDAGLSPNDIDYINAHGTSTPLNDVTETMAIKRLFGDHAYRLPISSTKSMTGHSLGASGALEAIACIKTITDGIIHPTINYEYPDPACDLYYVPNQARRQKVDVVLSNSFGFGGQNACIVFRRFDL